MAEKKVFGPQRKPVPNVALDRSPEQNMQMLDQMRGMRDQIDAEAGREPRPSASPISQLQQDMPPEVQAQLERARAEMMQRQAEAEAQAREAENNWIETPPEQKAPPPPRRPAAPPIPGSLTNVNEGQRPGRAGKAPRIRQQKRPTAHLAMSPALQGIIDKIKPITGVYEPIELPSRGVFYDGTDGPKDGVLHVRPMTGEEEQILATQRFVKDGLAMDMIFKACLQEQYDPAMLLSQDRTYLMIYLRGISYTPRYDVEISCPACRTKFNYPLNLDDMWIDLCPLDFGPESLHDVMPVTGLEFAYRLSRGADEMELQQYQNRQLAERGAESKDDTLTFRTVQLLEAIVNPETGDQITDKQEIEYAVAQLPGGDSAYLRQTVTEPPFGVDTRMDIDCQNPACGNTFGIAMPMAIDFFFPRPKKGSRTRATS